MTDISDDYDPFWDDVYERDDRYDYEPDDERDYEPDPMEGYEPDLADYYERAARERHEDYLASLSPLGRLAYDIRDFIWRRSWRWRMKISARWLLLTGRAATEPDEPPF